ncbi:MAG: 3'-5' exonuclease [Polyangiaceae bacterium]|nr:3'-5' exonuclease [Polyangiaceae bacterium]
MKGGADGHGCFPSGKHYPGIAHLLEVLVAGLAEEFPGDTPLDELTIVGLDTETTGREASDRIVEIACVRWRGGVELGRTAFLVNPECPITEGARAVHGIDDATVAGEPPIAARVPELLEALRGAVPLAYNAEFDRGVLTRDLERAGASAVHAPPALRSGVEWLDPLTWARELQRNERSRALGDVCARLGIELGQAHRAADDCVAALRVFDALRADERVPRTYAAFVREQRRLAQRFEAERKTWRNRG